MTEAPLILTLGMHPDDQARFERLRQLHFPANQNVIPAHLTLFHHLPGDQLASIQDTLQQRCGAVAPFAAATSGVRFLGRGVAYSLQSQHLAALRAGLARQWADWLTPQDRQGWRPHVTVQNKTTPEAARALQAQLLAGFTPFDVRAEGLLLWRYLDGPWEAVSEHRFV